MSKNKFNLISVLFILLLSILSNIKYFIDGKSIYHITSIAASPLYYLKLQLNHFQNFNFYPPYWINHVYTGGPIHTGLGVYNPLLILLMPFSNFSHAMIFYDVLLKLLGGVSLYFLLRKYGFSETVSLACSLIYPLDPFYIVWGQDPQMSSIIYFIPLVIYLLEKLFEEIHDNLSRVTYSLTLGLALSVCYLSSNIQSYTFLFLFIVFPFLILRLNFQNGAASKRHLKRSFKIIYFIGLVMVVNILLILFEIIPTLKMMRFGDNENALSHLQYFRTIFYSLSLVFIAICLHYSLKSKRLILYLFVISFIIASLFLSQGKGTLQNLFFDNYFLRIDEASYFSNQGMTRYYFTLLQIIILIFGIINLKKAKDDKKLLLLDVAISYFVINCLMILLPEKYSEPFPYYKRYSFVPFVGIIIGIAYGLALLELKIGKGKIKYILYVLLIILPLENYYVYLNRTLFTDDLSQINRKNVESIFLGKMRETERVIDTYENEHQEWRKSFKPKNIVKWLMPPYFGAHTFSKVGIGLIPKENQEYNKMAMPLYFGVDREKPLTPLLNLAGVKYILSMKSMDQQKNLKLLQKGDEYFIYENMEVFPRVLLFSEVINVDEKKILPVLMSQSNKDLMKSVYISTHENVVLNNSGKNDIYLMNDTSFHSNLGKVFIRKYESEMIEIDCDIKEESLFMITDTFYEGWRAFIENKGQSIIRSDYIYRGLKLNPGRYVLVMKYEPKSNRVSLYITLVTSIIVTSLLLYCFTAKL